MRWRLLVLGLSPLAACGLSLDPGPAAFAPGADDAAIADAATRRDGDTNDGGTRLDGEVPGDGFCASAPWTFCEDFEGMGNVAPAPYPAPSSRMSFYLRSPRRVDGHACGTAIDCEPYVSAGVLHTVADDPASAASLSRIHPPFDFAERVGRIHFRSDLNGSDRSRVAIHLTPTATSELPDWFGFHPLVDRSPSLTIMYRGDNLIPFDIRFWVNGDEYRRLSSSGPLGLSTGLHDVDVLISRTRLRIEIDGREALDEPLGDLMFDRAYVYFGQMVLDPAGEDRLDRDANTARWDNIAFDGPAHPDDGLVPTDQADVLFRAFSASRCTVRGTPAEGTVHDDWGMWHTWRARLPLESLPIQLTDVSCELISESPSDDPPTLLEIIQR